MSLEDKRLRQLDLLGLLLHDYGGEDTTRLYGLVDGYGVPTDDCARRSVETKFRRDRDDLTRAGIPVTGPGGGWRADPGALLAANPGFTDAEAEVIALAATADFDSTALEKVAAGAGRKVAAHRAASVPAGRARLSVRAPDLRLDDGELARLAAALRARTAIRFWYSPGAGLDDELRELEPWAIVLHRSRVYLTGYDRDRGDRRVFRMQNISEVCDLLIDYDGQEIPSPAQHPRPAADEIRAMAAHAHEMGAAAIDVVVDINPGTCGDVTAMAEDLGGGRWLLRGIGGNEARALALEHAGRLAVIEPQGLRDDVIAALAAIAADAGEGTDHDG